MSMTTKEGIAHSLTLIGEYGFSGIDVYSSKPYDAFAHVLSSTLDSATMLRVYAEVKRQGLLDFHTTNDQVRITITPFGANRLLAHTANTVTIPAMKKWDHKWRVVTYDIPKGKDKERVFLNRRLKELGFKMLNKSLWVHPFKCDNVLQKITDYCNLSNSVIYMEVTYIEPIIESKLFKLFEINK
jgi:DNA-binding transcriptional regulator PaaX